MNILWRSTFILNLIGTLKMIPKSRPTLKRRTKERRTKERRTISRTAFHKTTTCLALPPQRFERLARFIDRNAEDVRSIVNGFDSLARHDAVDQPDIVSSSHAPEPRSGTVDVSDIQKAIWHEFSSRPEEVRRIAFDIRKTALGAGIEPQREIPWPIPLTLVRQLEEIVKSVDQFNRQAGIAPELVRGAAAIHILLGL